MKTVLIETTLFVIPAAGIVYAVFVASMLLTAISVAALVAIVLISKKVK